MNAVIVGGGLSGLVAAWTILTNECAGLSSVVVLEASSRLGGRAYATADGIDLGGSWVWSSNFPSTRKLVKELGVQLMAHPGGSSDEFRVPGGLPSLIHTLQSQAAAAATVNNVKFEVRLNTRVAQLLATEATEDSTAAAAAASNNHTVRLALTGAEEEEGRSIDADMVLLAMPTRLAATSIEWQPALPGALASAMRLQNTWMGGMGKVAFVYDKPWWRELRGGLNIHTVRPPGRGPAVQLMDGSTENDGVFALVAFLAPDLDMKAEAEAETIAAARRQVDALAEQLTGAAAPKASRTEHMLWGLNDLCFSKVPEGASRPDVYYSHPEPWPARHTEQLAAHYGGRVFLCGSETDTSHPGYIEGAVRTGKKGAEAVQDVVAATCRA